MLLLTRHYTIPVLNGIVSTRSKGGVTYWGVKSGVDTYPDPVDHVYLVRLIV